MAVTAATRRKAAIGHIATSGIGFIIEHCGPLSTSLLYSRLTPFLKIFSTAAVVKSVQQAEQKLNPLEKILATTATTPQLEASLFL